MKKYSVIISILIFLIILFYLFVIPKIKSNNYSLNAIVISINPESKRSGISEIEINQDSITRYIYYSFLDIVPDISVGDSLIKLAGSKILFVKSKKNGVIREAKDQNYIIGP